MTPGILDVPEGAPGLEGVVECLRGPEGADDAVKETPGLGSASGGFFEGLSVEEDDAKEGAPGLEGAAGDIVLGVVPGLVPGLESVDATLEELPKVPVLVDKLLCIVLPVASGCPEEALLEVVLECAVVDPGSTNWPLADGSLEPDPVVPVIL